MSKVRKLAGHHKRHSRRLRRFARIGTGGKYLNNIYRDMWRLLRKSHAVEPMMIRVPMKTRHMRDQVIQVLGYSCFRLVFMVVAVVSESFEL